MSDPINHNELVGLTATVVSAYVAHNKIEGEALPGLIKTVYSTLKCVPAEAEAPVAVVLQPAVPVKKSVARNHVVCLECGAKMKMLRRHLQSAHNMTADEYLARWGLPKDHPLVAPEYAEVRSGLAKQIGLGSRNKE